MTFNCCALDDGRRLISESDIQEKLGGIGGKLRKIRKELEEDVGGPMPLFLASKSLIPLVNEEFSPGDLPPIEYNVISLFTKPVFA